MPRSGRVSLVVFDVRGQRVRTLVDADLPAGRHAVRWDGRDQSGRGVPSAPYLARARQGAEMPTR